MGKMDRLRNKVEPFLSYFGLSELYLPTPDPAGRPGITPPPQSMALYGNFLFNSQRRRSGSRFSFLDTYVLYLW